MRRRSRRAIALLTVEIIVVVIVFGAYQAGVFEPPRIVQQWQTASQVRLYEEYPKPPGMEEVGTERYTLTHDTFGPRAGRIRIFYSLPADLSPKETIEALRQAAPSDMTVVDNVICQRLAADRAPGPALEDPPATVAPTPDPTDSRVANVGSTVTILAGDGDDWGSGVTFTLVPATSREWANEADLLASDPSLLLVEADHPNFGCYSDSALSSQE